MFSDRTGWDREASSLTRALEARRQSGLAVVDLTASNPTRCGFVIDSQALLRPLASPAGMDYDPQPFGGIAAREAVSGYYAQRGAVLPPEQICLTTSTSEAYSFLFRLLCDPGDEVLIASPSYPLFDYLATLDNIRLVSFPLVYDHGWQILPGELEERITPRTRAVALVHPNNPTGHFVSRAERRALEVFCAERGLALIVDEVFLDYAWSGSPQSFATGEHVALTFVLSGLSKIAGLPQMKLAWMGVLGPQALRAEALARLEIIADTFLSVNAPTQAALPHWMEAAQGLREQIVERVAANLSTLDTLVAVTPLSRLQADGGWYAVLRIPALEPDEAFAERLLERHGILVHPGSAFGFVGSGTLVLSLLPEPAQFGTAVKRIVEEVLQSSSDGGIF